jgi:hypothetical protein
VKALKLPSLLMNTCCLACKAKEGDQSKAPGCLPGAFEE